MEFEFKNKRMFLHGNSEEIEKYIIETLSELYVKRMIKK